MGILVAGDVVAISWPYTDMSASKRRPAVVLAHSTYNDYIMCPITSRAGKDEFSIELNSKNFTTGGLKHDSFVCSNRIMTLNIISVCKKVGTIDSATLTNIKANAVRAIWGE